jgi:hypothetical protein
VPAVRAFPLGARIGAQRIRPAKPYEPPSKQSSKSCYVKLSAAFARENWKKQNTDDSVSVHVDCLKQKPI